ncbi:MAG: Maf family protein [Persicimonas sp.]
MSEIVLASGSRYKQRLMRRLGLSFDICPADIDESAAPREAPEALAGRLARQKARRVAQVRPDTWIIGADQVIALGDKRFSKPGDELSARAQLAELSGRTHRLITAVALLSPAGEFFEDVVVFEMQMRTLADEEIAAYVAEDMPLDCAGSYKIEAGGIRLFRALRGDDYTAIVGLPLTRVRTLLERGGYFNA